MSHFLGDAEWRREGKRTKNGWARLLRRMERLVGCRVDDTVKLAFLDGEQLREIDGLDLGAPEEFKRSGNDAVGLKLVDRAVVLERLVELSGDRKGGAEEFFRALWESADTVQGLFPTVETCAHLVMSRREAKPGGGYSRQSGTRRKGPMHGAGFLPVGHGLL